MSLQPTNTATQPQTRVDFPGLSFTLTHPTPDQPGVSTLNFHPGSPGSIPPHWHETHREHIRVVRGYMLVTVGTLTKLYGPGDGVVDIPPYTVHAMERGDTPRAKQYWAGVQEMKDGWQVEDVVTEEWTSPSDGQKEVFFRNSMSLFMDKVEPILRRGVGLFDVPSLLATAAQVLSITSHGDNFGLIVPLAVGRGKDGKANLIGRSPIYLLHAFARIIDAICGRQFWKAEYTPTELQAVCKAM